MVPALLRGDETWCQGFSEPGTGSNLASLSCRAVRTDGGWRVTGQKVWTSLAQYAQRCVLLTRTGPAGLRPPGDHRPLRRHGLPGITVRPIETMHGSDEFSEVFFDDVTVPFDRTLGQEGDGWAGGHGPAALRAQHGALAPGRLPAPPAPGAPRHRPARLARSGPARRGHPAPLRLPGPLPRAPSTAWPPASSSARRPRSTRSCWPPPSRRSSTWWPTPDRRRHRRRRPGQPTVAHRVPLLAGGLDLRRERRDPAEHHRPPPARPRERPLMDDEDRRLFEASLRKRHGPALGRRPRRRPRRAGMGATPWRPIRGPPSPCSSSSKERSTPPRPRSARCSPTPSEWRPRPGTAGSCCPPIGRWDPPGAVDGDVLVVRGLASTGSSDRRRPSLVVTSMGERTRWPSPCRRRR